MKPETRYWRTRVKPALDAMENILYNRIESGTTSGGIPDLSYSCPSGHGWIELKIGHVKGDRLCTPTMTPVQANWLKTRGDLAGKVYILVLFGGDEFLYRHHQGRALKIGIPVDGPGACHILTSRGLTKDQWTTRLNQILLE
jgi:hypothetical protein